MLIGAIGNVRDLIEIAISGAAVLGGAMAFVSGWAASRSVAGADPPEVLADRINRGLAFGFRIGLPFAGLGAIFLAVN
jgi:hypothetical protein